VKIKKQFILYGGLVLCVLGFGGNWAYDHFYDSARKELADKQHDLEEKLDKRQKELKRTKKTAKNAAAFEHQSLPSNVDVARSVYRSWLIQQVEQAGIVSPNVDSGSPANHHGLFQSLPFSIRGRATLEQLTRFLYAFYRANHLHQIQSLGITPLSNSPQLDISLSIEALILPGADRADRLADGPSEAWTARQFDEFRSIVRRNLFAAGGALDSVAQTFLSGITAVDGRFQAWFDLRASNKTVKLSVGDTLDVGEFRGTVVDIDKLDVTLESAGERWLISVGENLDQAFAVPQLDTASASR